MIPDYRLDPPAEKGYPPCPVCGNENYYSVYKDRYGDVVGCSYCIQEIIAEDYAEEEEERDRD